MAQLLRQEPIQAENRQELKNLLKVSSGGVVFTTIQKFQPDEGNVYERLSPRDNIVVIADEAHRTQYGFKAKTVDDKDEQGNVIGKKLSTDLKNTCVMHYPMQPILVLQGRRLRTQM